MRYAKKPLSKTAVVFVFSQFPIGKVKVGRRLKRCARSLYVSIPYGKGKVGAILVDGKDISCINSLWER